MTPRTIGSLFSGIGGLELGLERAGTPLRDAIRASSGPGPSEPCVGRVAHGVPNRVDRLKQLGNAVVPQCAEAVGRLIMSIS